MEDYLTIFLRSHVGNDKTTFYHQAFRGITYIALVIAHTLRHRAIFAFQHTIGAHSYRGHQTSGRYTNICHTMPKLTRFLAMDGALGHFHRIHKINIKAVMMAHLETLTKDMDHDKVMNKMMHLFRGGHFLHDFAETVQDEFNLQYVRSYYHVWLALAH